MKLIDRLNTVINCMDSLNSNKLSGKYTLSPYQSYSLYKFNAENAYSYISRQVSFGPRIPGTTASSDCADWILHKLKVFGLAMIAKQIAYLKAYNGDELKAINISAQINPEVNDRILFIAHWDSRPWADNDPNPRNRIKPVEGANDGASGVSVLLELARIFADSDTKLGLDFLFIDAEDYGQIIGDNIMEYNEYSWCLGSQYWLQNPTLPVSKISFAVLLDMVGGKNAIFHRELFSENAATHINDLIWKSAHYANHGDRFIDKVGNGVLDDHIHFIINNIPSIVIIENTNPNTGTFPITWHTLDDTIENIDMESLQAVGETLEHLVYSIQPNTFD